jgi:hypothetical protein
MNASASPRDPARRAILVGALVPGLAAAAALAPPPLRRVVQQGELLQLEWHDLTPQFMDFLDAAEDLNDSDPDKRFALWKQRYGVAAVPPGPHGEALARAGLVRAWPRYAELRETLRAGAAALGPEPLPLLERVAQVLRVEGRPRIRLISFVGQFDGGAFSYRADMPVLAIPLEGSAARREIALLHEGTHALHMTMADISGQWLRSVATTALQEGLAMHLSAQLAPHHALPLHLGGPPGWWAQVSERRRDILTGLRDALSAEDERAVLRFTFGPGPAGLVREAYAAGWWLVEAALARGSELGTLARWPGATHPARLRELLETLL